MKTFKQYIFEKKDHIIKKLPNLSPEQKKELIDFFKRKPNLEGKIDWNNKNLTYDDFKDVMKVTKTEKVKLVKSKGISGLKEGEDYLKLKTPPEYEGYIPLTYEASKLIASKKAMPKNRDSLFTLKIYLQQRTAVPSTQLVAAPVASWV